jgi:hypothetical protein
MCGAPFGALLGGWAAFVQARKNRHHCGLLMTHARLICLAALCALASAPAQARKQKPVPSEPLPAESQSLLQDRLPDAPKQQLGCDGPFARDTTHARLAAAFGASNVAFKEIDGAEGTRDKATVLFDDDPTRRAVVYWRDLAARANPTSILVSAPSTWVGPGGVHNGLPLKDVEKLNGAAFKLNGFGWDGGGFVSGFKGALAAPAGGCTLTVRFEPGIANPLPPKFAAITGDKEVLSSNPLMRRARPQVSEWTVNYR